jgi:hypothetical protein
VSDADAVQVKVWRTELGTLHARVAGRFARPEPSRRALAYLQALMAGDAAKAYATFTKQREIGKRFARPGPRRPGRVRPGTGPDRPGQSRRRHRRAGRGDGGRHRRGGPPGWPSAPAGCFCRSWAWPCSRTRTGRRHGGPRRPPAASWPGPPAEHAGPAAPRCAVQSPSGQAGHPLPQPRCRASSVVAEPARRRRRPHRRAGLSRLFLLQERSMMLDSHQQAHTVLVRLSRYESG